VKKTNQKILYLIIAILLIIIITVFYFSAFNPAAIRNFATYIGLVSFNFPLSQGKFPELSSFPSHLLTNYWATEKCSISKQDSMINIIHVKIIDGVYHYDCEFGNLYSGAKDFQTKNDNPVWLGVAKNCSLQTAREIDSAVRTILSCKWPMENTLPANVTDYYAFNVACDPIDVAKELAEVNSANPRFIDLCRGQITNFANLTYGFGKGYLGVIDTSTGRVYE
jgi:hypothetical protein